MEKNKKELTVITCEYKPFPGGIGTYAARMVESLRAAGVGVVVIAPQYDEFPEIQGDPACARILMHHAVPLSAIPKILSLLRNQSSSSKVLAADIRAVLLTYATRLFHRRPYHAMVHGSEASKFKAGTPMAWLVGRAYRGADVVLFNSHATRELFEAAFGPVHVGRVAYLGVDERWLEGGEDGFANAELRALPADRRLVCSVGRIEPRKGQLEGVGIVARARNVQGLGDLVYVIAGRTEDKTYADEVVAEAKRLSVPLIMSGRIADGDLKQLYRRSLCHLLFARALPGKVEGFGLVLLEAAAQGCPSIATEVGGIPEVVADAGVRVADGDVDAAAAALVRLAMEPDYRAALGARALARARTFSWNACAMQSFPEYFEGSSSPAPARPDDHQATTDRTR